MQSYTETHSSDIDIPFIFKMGIQMNCLGLRYTGEEEDDVKEKVYRVHPWATDFL